MWHYYWAKLSPSQMKPFHHSPSMYHMDLLYLFMSLVLIFISSQAEPPPRIWRLYYRMVGLYLFHFKIAILCSICCLCNAKLHPIYTVSHCWVLSVIVHFATSASPVKTRSVNHIYIYESQCNEGGKCLYFKNYL